MAETKERLFLNMKDRLLKVGYDPQQVNDITTMLAFELSNVEFTAISTELSTMDFTDERLVDLYSSVLITSGRSRKTIDHYRLVLRNFRKDVSKTYKEVSPHDVIFWLAMKQEKVKLATCSNQRIIIHSFYEWLKKEGFVTDNPVSNTYSVKVPYEIKEGFTDVEVDLLRSACETLRERAELEVLLSSGVRLAELCNLNKEDVDFLTNQITVRRGKGAKDRKTFISPVAAMRLKKYLATRTDNDECLFYTRVKKRLTDDMCQRDLKRLSERSGVPDVHPHKCRHTFASTMWKRGMDLRSIQILLGHANVNMTTKYINNDISHVENEFKRYC